MPQVYIQGVGTVQVDDRDWPADEQGQHKVIDDITAHNQAQVLQPSAAERFGASVGQVPINQSNTLNKLGDALDGVAGGIPSTVIHAGGTALDWAGRAVQGVTGALGHGLDSGDFDNTQNRATDPRTRLNVSDITSHPVGYTAQAAGDMLPYVTTGPLTAAAMQFTNSLGPTVDEIAGKRAQKDGSDPKPTEADWEKALGTSAAEATIMGLAAKFGGDKGSIKALLKSMGLFGAASGADTAVHEGVVDGSISPSDVINSAAGGAIGAGAFHAGGDIAGAVRSANSELTSGRQYSTNPDQMMSDARLAKLLAAKRGTTADYATGFDAQDSNHFKGIADDLKGKLHDLTDSLADAQDITDDQADDLKGVIAKAAKHNRELGENGKANGYFNAEVDTVKALNLKPDVEKTFLNTLRDLNSANFNGYKKNQRGPIERYADALRLPEAAAGLGGAGVAVATGGADIGLAGLTGLAARAGVRGLARGADKALGLAEPPIIRRAAARAKYFQQNGINPGDTVRDVTSALGSVAARTPAARPSTKGGPDTELDRAMRDVGVERHGGWMKSMREAGSQMLPPGESLQQSDVLRAINDMHDKGYLTDEQRDALFNNKNGKIPNSSGLYYRIQDHAVHLKLGREPLRPKGSPPPTEQPEYPSSIQRLPAPHIRVDENGKITNSNIRNPASYAQTMRNVETATRAATDEAPNDAMRAVVAEVANARTKADKSAALDRARQAHPEHWDYLDQFVRPLTEFGPKDSGVIRGARELHTDSDGTASLIGPNASRARRLSEALRSQPVLRDVFETGVTAGKADWPRRPLKSRDLRVDDGATSLDPIETARAAAPKGQTLGAVFGDKRGEQSKPEASKPSDDPFDYIDVKALKPEQRAQYADAIRLGNETIKKLLPNHGTGALRAVRTVHADLGNGRLDPMRGLYTRFEHNEPVIYYAMEVNGERLPNNEVRNTVRHEAIHMLRDQRFFTDDEWHTLAEAALENGWIRKHDIDERYKGAPDDSKIEEAVAHEFGAAAENSFKGYSPRVRKVFQKLYNLFRDVYGAVKRGLGDQMNAHDVMRQIERGVIGWRKPKGPRASLADLLGQKQRLARAHASDAQSGDGERKVVGYDIIDGETGKPVSERYGLAQGKRARRRAERLNLNYGAHRYRVVASFE